MECTHSCALMHYPTAVFLNLFFTLICVTYSSWFIIFNFHCCMGKEIQKKNNLGCPVPDSESISNARITWKVRFGVSSPLKHGGISAEQSLGVCGLLWAPLAFLDTMVRRGMLLAGFLGTVCFLLPPLLLFPGCSYDRRGNFIPVFWYVFL